MSDYVTVLCACGHYLSVVSFVCEMFFDWFLKTQNICLRFLEKIIKQSFYLLSPIYFSILIPSLVTFPVKQLIQFRPCSIKV